MVIPGDVQWILGGISTTSSMLMFFYFTLKSKLKKAPTLLILWSAMAVEAVLIMLIVTFTGYTKYYPILINILFWIPLFSLFHGDAAKKSYIFFSGYLFTYIFLLLLHYAIERISRFASFDVDSVFTVSRLILTVILIVLCKLFVSEHIRGLLQNNNRKLWYSFSTIPAVAFIFLAVTYVPNSSEPVTVTNELAFWSQIVLIVFIFVFFDQCISIVFKKFEQEKELEATQKLLRIQKAHYQFVQENVNKLRYFKHDFHHHINTLAGLNESAGKEAVAEYLKELNGSLQDLNLIRVCKNETVNAIASQSLSQIKSRKIGVTYRIDLPEKMNLTPTELSVLLGNAVENAIEACKKVPEAERFIRILMKTHGNKLLIHVENSYTGERKADGENLLSLKPGGGTGIRSMREVVSRHSGDLSYSGDGHTFSLMMTLNNDDAGATLEPESEFQDQPI